MIRRTAQRGIALVEFAIVAPLLLFVMLSVAELGRAFVHYTVLANSARDAARYLAGLALNGSSGVLKTSTEWAQLEDATKKLAVYGNTGATGSPLLPGYKVSQVTVSKNAADGRVSVTLVYPYQSMLGSSLPTFGYGSGAISLVFNMRVVVVMRAI